jgi:hypothetical protein
MNVYRVTLWNKNFDEETYYDVLCNTIAEAIRIAEKRTRVNSIRSVAYLTQITVALKDEQED